MANQIKFKVGFDVDKTSLNQLRSSLQQMQNLNYGDLIKINKSGLPEAKKTLVEIQNQAGRVEDALKAAFNPKLGTINIEKFNSILNSTGKPLNEIYSTFKKAGAAGENAFRNLSGQLLKVKTQAKETSTLFNKMAITFANTVKWNISSAVFNTMTNSIQQAWNFTKALDSSLNDIRIVTGKSADEMADFAVKANEAARSLGKSTKDYTNASLIYAQQGLSDKEIQARTNITLKTANVTGQAASDVSEQLTAVWNSYRVGAEEAEIYVDRLAAVAAKSASNLEELSRGMSKVASAAATMGVSEEQLAAQLSTIISVTRQAPQTVGTALKTVYARITDIQAGLDSETSLGNYSGKMAEFGINVLDANNKLRDMGEVIEEIGGKWSTMTREQQIALTQTMGGQRQYSNLIALFDSFDKYNEMMQIAANAQGTLQKQQDTYMQRTTAHLQQLSTASEKLFMNLADNDGINNLVDGLTTVISLTNEWVESIGGISSLLPMLGGLGVKVFSKDIAESIYRVSNNLKIGQQEIDPYAEKLKAVREELEIQDLDESTRELLEIRERYYQSASRMSEDEREKNEQLINDIEKQKNALASLGEKIELIEQKFSRVTGEKISIDDIIADPKVVDTYIAQLNDLKKEYEQLYNNIREVRKGFNEARQSAKQSTNKKERETSRAEIARTAIAFEKQLQDALSKNIPERYKQAVIKAQNQLKSINKSGEGSWKNKFTGQDFKDDEAIQKLDAIIIEFQKRTEIIKQEASQEIKQMLKTRAEGIEELKRQRDLIEGQEERHEQTFFSEADRRDQINFIEDLTEMSGGLMQVYSGMSQIANLGNIWSQSESFGEGFLKTLVMLGTALPNMISGVLTANKAIKALKEAHIGERIAALKSALAETAFGKASLAAALSGKTLKEVLTMLELDPLVIGFVALTAALVAIPAIIDAINKSTEDQIESNKKIIEQQNEKQQQLKKNEELYSSLEELNNQYQSNQIALSDLKEKTQELLESYNAEDQIVQKLTKDYSQYSDVLSELTKENIKAQYESAKTEKAKASENLRLAAKGKLFDDRTELFGNIYLQEGYSSDQDAKLDQIMAEAGFDKKYLHLTNAFLLGDPLHTYAMTIKNDSESIEAAYEKISKAVSKMTPEQYQSTAGKDLIKLQGELKEAVDTYSTSVDQASKAAARYQALYIDFSNNAISSTEEYALRKEALVHRLRQQEKMSEEQAKKAATAYLRTYENTLYKGFETKSKILQKIQGDSEQGLKALDKMSEQQLEAIEGIDITNWETFQNIVKYLEKVDLSKLKVVEEPFAGLDAAIEQFNLYNSLSEQIAGSKKATISGKEFQKLSDEIQQFFTLTANGTYKLTGDAIEFYDAVQGKSLQQFKNNLQSLYSEQERLQRMVKPQQIGSQHGEDLSRSQLDYLFEIHYDKKKLIEWEAALAQGGKAAKDVAKEISGAFNGNIKTIQSLIKTTNNFTDKLKNVNEAIFSNEYQIGLSARSVSELKNMLKEDTIHIDAFNAAYLQLRKQLDNELFDPKEVIAYADYLQKIAKESDEVADALATDRQGALAYAKDVIKLNKGIEKLAKNWADWKDILDHSTEGSIEYQQALDGVRSALYLLTGTDEDFIKDDFIKEHFDEITKAAKGSEEAIDSLKKSLATETFEIAIDAKGFDKSQKAALLQEFENFQAAIPDLEAGISLDDEAFIKTLNDLIQDAKLTVPEINTIFSNLELEPDYKQTQQEISTTVPEYESVTTPTFSSVKVQVPNFLSGILGETSYDLPLPSLKTSTVITGSKTVSGDLGIPSLGVNKSAPEVKSVRKKAPADASNYSSRNKGGKSSSGKKSGGGKKGGGGSGSKADTSQKDLKKPLEDERDIYHDINIEIEQINRELERTQKTQDKLYGKQLLNSLNEQSQILENHKAKLKEKQKIQQQDLKTQISTLKLLGVTFDAYNNIANYMDILAQKQTNINKLTEEYNKLVESYNKSTNKDTKTAINERIEAKSKEIQEAEDARKNLEDKIKNYDDLRETMEDLIDEIEDETQQQIEIAITKFRMQLEIRLELGEAERDWNEFKRKVLNHTDIIKDSDFSKLFKDTQQSVEDLLSYFDAGTVTKLTEQLSDTKAEIEAIDKIGESAIYGANKTQAMEDLKSDLDALIGQLENIQDLVDSIDQSYLDTIDDIKDGFDEQIKDYELITELLEHDVDLLTLLYGEKNYDAMNKYYSSLQENQNKQIDSLRQQRDFWKAEWDAAVARGDIAAAQKFKEQYAEALKNLNSTIQTAAQTLQDKYTNAIDKIFDELDKRISDNKGIDYLELEWELMNKNSDEYLDTINSAFKLQDLQTKFTKALNDTKSLKGQREIKKLMDEQLKNLKAKDKLTEYDVQRAEKLLQIEQARIALEDAQASKTTMRLKRDAQGNYSYQFVANNDKVLEAQQNLANTQNDLYNFDKEKYQSNLNDMMSAWKDFQSQYKEIQLDTSLTEEQRTKKLALLREKYEEYINNKVAENQTIRNNLRDSAFADYAALYGADVEAYQKMSDKEKDILMSELVPAWDSGIQQMVDVFSKEGGFTGVTEEAFKNLDEVAKDYASDLQALFSNAGVNVDSLKSGAEDTVESFSDLVEKNDDLIGRMKTELTAIEDLRKGAKELMNQYNAAYESAKKMVSVVYQFNKKQQQEAADAAKKEATTKPVTPVSATASSSTVSSSTTSSKISTSTTTSKIGAGNGQGSSTSGANSNKTKTKGSINKNGENLKDQAYEKMKQLESQILKYEDSFNSAKNHVPTQALKASYLSPVLKLQKELNSVIKNVQKTNLKDAQKLQTKADTSVKNMQQYIKKVTNPSSVANNRTTGIATSQYGLLQPTNTLEKHTIGKDSFGQWISSNPSFFKKINTFYIENYLGSIWKNYKTHRKYTQYYDSKKKRHFIDVGSFDTGGYTGNWADQQGRLALLHKKELVLNSSDTENMLTMINITREILKNLNSNVFMRTSKIGSLTPKNNNANDTIEQNVRIEASFPNVDSKREIEEAFNDLVNLAAQRALQ